MDFIYTDSLIKTAYTYLKYREILDQKLAEPAGSEESDKYRPHMAKNVKLMEGYDKSYVVSDALISAIKKAPIAIWLVITEGWCGDAAFSSPMLAAIERAVPEKVKLRFLFRDENLDLIDAHLTDGGRSIPKVIMLNEALKEVGVWGPRPAELQPLLKEWKLQDIPFPKILVMTKEWYDHDATESTQDELLTLVTRYS
jgi:hypothetical protein